MQNTPSAAEAIGHLASTEIRHAGWGVEVRDVDLKCNF